MQTLEFEGKGTMKVIRTFTENFRHLHQTEDGFYYAPGQPLRDLGVAGGLPAPFNEKAVAFVESLQELEKEMAMKAFEEETSPVIPLSSGSKKKKKKEEESGEEPPAE